MKNNKLRGQIFKGVPLAISPISSTNPIKDYTNLYIEALSNPPLISCRCFGII